MELKDILGFFDSAEVKTLDEFKEKFNGKFAPKADLDEANKKVSEITGKIKGGIETQLKRVFAFSADEIKDKKIEDLIELGASKYKTELDELKATSGQGNDKALQKALGELEKTKKTLDEERVAKEGLQATLEKTTGEFEGKVKGLKIGSIFENAKSKVIPKLKSDMSPAEKLGYEASIKEFNIDFDDKDQAVVKDKEGNRLKNPNKAGSFLSLEEALELKAAELNLIKKNNGGSGSGTPQFFAPVQQQNGSGEGQDPTKNPQGRKIHAGALSNAERQKATT